MEIKQLVGFGFAGSLLLAVATGGKQGLQSAQAYIDQNKEYAAKQESVKTSIDTAKQESMIAWKMVKQEGCLPPIGLSPDPEGLKWVTIPLSVGQIATVGGKIEQPFAPVLICTSTQIARVGIGGRLQSPIDPNSSTLPYVPVDERPGLIRDLTALKAMPNTPQVVVSSLQELSERRMRKASTTPVTNPVTEPIKSNEATAPVPNQVTAPMQTAERERVETPPTYPTFGEETSVTELPKVTTQ